jgi:hypothetical protein
MITRRLNIILGVTTATVARAPWLAAVDVASLPALARTVVAQQTVKANQRNN